MTGMTGTFTHMAPEVLFATAGYSEKADIFSCAVCMVHLISGEHTYAADAVWCASQPELLARRVALEGYRAPLEHKIKKDMQDLLTRMWAHEPSHRPSAAECGVELAALLATVKSKPPSSPLAAVLRRLHTSSPKGGDIGGGASPLAAIRRFSAFSSSPRGSSYSPIAAIKRTFSAASRQGSSLEAGKGTCASSPSRLLPTINHKLETRNKKHETRNQKPSTINHKPQSSPLAAIKRSFSSPVGSPLSVIKRSFSAAPPASSWDEHGELIGCCEGR